MTPPNTPFTIHFDFDARVPAAQLDDTLTLASMAVQSLFSPERAALEASTRLDTARRCVSVNASTEVGHSLAVIFLGYCNREFGAGAVRVRREGGLA